MPAKCTAIFYQGRGKQRGAALMVMLVIVIMGIVAFLVSSLNSSALQTKRDKTTADALAQAKDALIGYASSVALTSAARLGDLPCPDTNNDGVAEASCGNAAGSNQAQRIGRLPWKTIGLADLRDGSGERLWYAVSNNFKNNTRTTCTASGQPGCLNSDTPGTISIFAPDGTLLNDGGGSTGVVAVIIAPREILKRQDGVQQDRSNAGINTASNYLDIVTVAGNTEDNANFTDGSSSNGFIQGRVKDSNGNIIVNDQLMVITRDNIMQPIQKRVAAEVKQCLNEYSANNNGRYPWAVPLNALTYYNDNSFQLFGRIPDTLYNTNYDSSGGSGGWGHSGGWGGGSWGGGSNAMASQWGPNCNTHISNTPNPWWLNWRELVFYGLADAYKPRNTSTVPSCGTCLIVNPPSAAANIQFVVIVAGKALAGQARSSTANKSTLSNYLEAPNNNGVSPFGQGAVSSTFNDTVVFQ